MIYNVMVGSSVLGVSAVGGLHGSNVEVGRTVGRTKEEELGTVVVADLAAVLSIYPFLTENDVKSSLRCPVSIIVVTNVITNALVDLFVIPLLCGRVCTRGW